MIGFLNAFLAGYLLDAALTLLDALGFAWAAAPRAWIAVGVLGAAQLVLLIPLFSTRVPARILLSLGLGICWLNLGAPPLGSHLPGAVRDAALGLLQLGFAFPALRWIRRQSRGTAWWFQARWLPAAPPSGRRLALGLTVLLVAPALMGLLLLGGAALWVDRASAGFVGFGSDGLTLAERHYRRGDQEVQLVGMSHVARSGVYDSLLEPSDDRATVILAEGVSDTEGLLRQESLQEPLAFALGLESQPSVSEMLGPEAAQGGGDVETPDIESADLDVNDFRRSSVEFLRLALRLNAAPGDPDAARALEALARGQGARELYAGVLDDVLYRRNLHLLERIDAALERYERVVVPWGVLHLPGIEAGLLSRGFRLTSSEQRGFLPYGALARAIARILAHSAPPESPDA